MAADGGLDEGDSGGARKGDEEVQLPSDGPTCLKKVLAFNISNTTPEICRCSYIYQKRPTVVGKCLFKTGVLAWFLSCITTQGQLSCRKRFTIRGQIRRATQEMPPTSPSHLFQSRRARVQLLLYNDRLYRATVVDPNRGADLARFFPLDRYISLKACRRTYSIFEMMFQGPCPKAGLNDMPRVRETFPNLFTTPQDFCQRCVRCSLRPSPPRWG